MDGMALVILFLLFHVYQRRFLYRTLVRYFLNGDARNITYMYRYITNFLLSITLPFSN